MLAIFRTPKSGKPEGQQEGYRQQSNRSPITPPKSSPSFNSTSKSPKSTSPKQPSIKSSPMSGSGHATTLVGKGLVFQGEVSGSGSIRVEGRFVGTIKVNSEVIIGEEGIVEGNVASKTVSVLGKIKGNVEVEDKITIDVSGSMIGDIAAPRVVVAEGAVYKGRIDMESNVKPKEPEKIEPETKKEEPVEIKPAEPKEPEEKSPSKEPEKGR
jgi:cytoskeletal protein CcmA (bactofilin family)